MKLIQSYNLKIIILIIFSLVPLSGQAQLTDKKIIHPKFNKAINANANIPSKKGNLTPTNSFNDRFTQHRNLLEQRLNKLEQFNNFPENKKNEIKQNIQDEITWLDDAENRLNSASNEDERTTIRNEIKEHVKNLRQTRRQKLADMVELPKKSPVERAQTISEHFSNIINKLDQADVDITNSQKLYNNYQTAVDNLTQTYDTVTNDKSVENIEQLKVSIQNVRSATLALRNQLQSILVSNN